MIELKGLTYSYTKGRNAVEGLNATITPGLYLLLGENGAGKTTLLSLMAGLLKPTAGECLIDGTESVRHAVATMESLFMLTDEMNFPGKTFNELMRFHGSYYPGHDAEAFRARIARLGLTGDEPIMTMSLGTRKKLSVAYVLSLGVKTLLLDEPFNGVDITSRNELRRMLGESMTDETTIIVSTHTPATLSALYDGLLVMHGGRLEVDAKAWEITGRLAFDTGFSRREGALYSEISEGFYKSVSVNNDGRETKIDYELLYSALNSPGRETIVKLLKENR